MAEKKTISRTDQCINFKNKNVAKIQAYFVLHNRTLTAGEILLIKVDRVHSPQAVKLENK